MSWMTSVARDKLERLPLPVGRIAARVPMHLRPGIGRVYARRVAELERFDSSTGDERRGTILAHMQHLVRHAEQNVPFYRRFYAEAGFSSSELDSFESIQKIPIVTKDVLREVSLEDRSYVGAERSFEANTGGSSGSPLRFLVGESSVGHERAHMYLAWREFGFSSRDLILTFGGRSSVDGVVGYDAVRHALHVNIYADFEAVSKELQRWLKRSRVRFIHGYPSALYEFARFCEDGDPRLRQLLAESLEAGFLGSEFPQAEWRNAIERVFSIPTLSWYGHTERCVLAPEQDQRNIYFPYQTYGYAEEDDGRLVGTAYHSLSGPFIRYDTGDKIDTAVHVDGILQHFGVKSGRIGEFVVDRNGKRIPLTGLVFGRHHALFDVASSVQIAHPTKGRVIVCFVATGGPVVEPSRLFDTSNVDLKFEFLQIDAPVKTVAGKSKLLLTEDELTALS